MIITSVICCIKLFNGCHVLLKITSQRLAEDTVSYTDLKTSKEELQSISLRTSGVWALVRNTQWHDRLLTKKQAFGNSNCKD